jgi:small-conductance mechanosensitive channel
MESPIHVGDFIRLSSGEEGTVTDIGWRTTRIVMGVNNIIVIPNNKITSSTLVNHSLPSRMMLTDVEIPVGYGADVELVTRLIRETVDESLAAGEGALTQPAPGIVFEPGLLPTHMQFKLVMAVADRLHAVPLKTAIRLRLVKKFQAHDVPHPPPERLRG